MAIENEILRWSYKSQNTFLRLRSSQKFFMLMSKLFHLIEVDRKKEFLKKLCLVTKQRMLSIFFVLYALLIKGNTLERLSKD